MKRQRLRGVLVTEKLLNVRKTESSMDTRLELGLLLLESAAEQLGHTPQSVR